MNSISIDTKPIKYLQADIPVMLKYLLTKSGNEFGTAKFHLIADLLDSITDAPLLLESVDLIRRHGFLLKTKSFVLTNPADQWQVKHLASVFSLHFLNDFFTAWNDAANKQEAVQQLEDFEFIRELPVLKLEFDGSIIRHNIDEITDALQRKSILYARYFCDKKAIAEQEKHLKKLISSLNEMDFVRGTQTFDKAINYLRTEVENLQNVEIAIDKHYYEVFNDDGYRLFDYLMQNCISPNIGRPTDLSYYYWRMYEDGFIHRRPVGFIEWFTEHYGETIIQLKNYPASKFPSRRTIYGEAKKAYKSKK